MLQHFTFQQLIDAEFSYKFISKNMNQTHCFICRIYVTNWNKSFDFYANHFRFSSNYKWLQKHHEILISIKKHACKRCFYKFVNNIKLHEHVRVKHNKKFVKFTFSFFSFFSFISIFSFFSFAITIIIHDLHTFSFNFFFRHFHVWSITLRDFR